EYDRALKPEAKKLGCRASTLELEVKKTRDRIARETGAAGKAGAGRRLQMPEIEPWPGSVDGASALDEIAQAVARHVVTREGAPEAVALWAMHTHTRDAA